MKEKFGIDGMTEAVQALIAERGLSYYGILTNCRDKESGEYRKEVLLLSNNPEADGFLAFV